MNCHAQAIHHQTSLHMEMEDATCDAELLEICEYLPDTPESLDMSLPPRFTEMRGCNRWRNGHVVAWYWGSYLATPRCGGCQPLQEVRGLATCVENQWQLIASRLSSPYWQGSTPLCTHPQQPICSQHESIVPLFSPGEAEGPDLPPWSTDPRPNYHGNLQKSKQKHNKNKEDWKTNEHHGKPKTNLRNLGIKEVQRKLGKLI